MREEPSWRDDPPVSDVREVATLDPWALGCILLMALGMRLALMPDYLRYDELLHYLVTQSPLVTDFVREFRSLDHPPSFIC
jgi:hypothetical protein